jgi:hypothetical protein
MGADGASPSKFFEWRCRADCAAVIPPSLDWHCCANPSFFEKIITLFQ